MRIGIDVDGILADFNAHYIPLIVKLTGRDLFPPEYVPTTWEYPAILGYTTEEITAVWSYIENNKWFWYDLPTYPETNDSIRYLANRAKAGDDLYFITSRPGKTSKAQTEGWLARQGIIALGSEYMTVKHIPHITVLISSEKGLCARALKLDAYIDDRWENCLSIPFGLAPGVGTRTFLLDRPWNRAPEHDVEKYGFTRVSSVVGFADNPNP